jgi:hypothetical protein
MPGRKPSPALSLAMALLARLAICRERLREATEQLRQPRDDNDSSRIAEETIDLLIHWLSDFQAAPAARCDRLMERRRPDGVVRSCPSHPKTCARPSLLAP